MSGNVARSCLLLLFLASLARSGIIHVPLEVSTIQAGIDSASTGDTVLVQPGTYVENINFNGKNIVVGSLFLTIEDTAYISRTVIDGKQMSSVVMFDSGEDSSAVLSGFTLTNGRGHDPAWEIAIPPTAIGGGITCRDSSSPTLRDLVIKRNTAVAMGGGIYCLSSDPTITNVTLRSNSSNRGGGGIYCDSANPQLFHLTLSENISTYGGGIYCDNSSPTLTAVTIKMNSALIHGGGIYFDGNSNPEFDPDDRTNIYLNKSGDTGYDLFSITRATINVVVDTFTVTSPKEYHAYPTTVFDFDIRNGRIEQVKADLYVDLSGDNENSGLSLTVPLRTIDYALAKVDAYSTHPRTIHLASGVYSPSTTGEQYPLNWRSHISLLGADQRSTVLDAEGLSQILYCYNDNDFSVEKLTLQNGSASSGGAIYLKNSSPTLSKVSIIGNTASHGGGILCWDHSSPSLTEVTISGNKAGWGGGMYCGYYSSPILTNVTISDNIGDVYGGGINCWEHSSPILNQVTIANNQGAGLYCDDYSSPILTGVTISENTDRGIYCVAYSNPILKDVTIKGNSRGGVFLAGANATLTNVTILGNITDGGGGGIWLNHSSTVLRNVIIARNSAYVGGGIYCSESSLILANVTIAGNSIDNTYQNGGGIYFFDHSHITMVNTILWDNEPEQIFYSWGLPDDSNSVAINYSEIKGGETGIITSDRGTVTWGEGNIDTDPLFVDPENGDYRLQAGSPGIDAGTAFFVWQGDTLVDLSAVDYAGRAPDLGAYEYGTISIVDHLGATAIQFAVHQNFPNPFNPSTTIRYYLLEESRVSLSIFDMSGREVWRWERQEQAGYRQLIWNGRDLNSREVPAGVYIYRLVSTSLASGERSTASRKMVLLK